ncbi:MAG: sulfurtransferase TusA family protein, partial [Candidatus Saccharibacteria bacterium]
MDNVVDARGLTCPQPVILTKKALEQLQDGYVVTVVNDRTALENVIKLAKSMAYEVDIEEKGEEYHIHIGKGVDMTRADLDHYDG